jgi:hypothetical protein
MKKLLLLVSVMSLYACGSSSQYVAGGSEGLGSSTESRLTDDRYRVTFIGDEAATSDQVKDLALMRAAELTLANDYDWFRVVSQQTEESTTSTTTAPVQQVTTRDCGALGCTTTITPAYTGTQIVTVREEDRYTTSIEIVMGDGTLRDPTVAYDARELHNSLTRRY